MDEMSISTRKVEATMVAEIPETRESKQVRDEDVLMLLDSMDTYLKLMDSFSSTVRQGWLELASARHSMGESRINGALFDLKVHPAVTTLQITEHKVGLTGNQPQLALHKWESKSPSAEDEVLQQKRSNISDLRHRHATSPNSTNEEPQEKSSSSASDGSVNQQAQKERSKSLSVFGTLVSPKLRASQISFETALETLVELANMRSSILAAFDHIEEDSKPV